MKPSATLAARLRATREMVSARSAIEVAQHWRRRLPADQWLAVREACGHALAARRLELADRVRRIRRLSGLYQ